MPNCSREDDFLVDFEKCCKMRIWTRKSASIQRRTSLGKSDVSRLKRINRDLAASAEAVASANGAELAAADARGWRFTTCFAPAVARTQQSFGGSFSAGSKPIFASKYAFFSIFQNLQEYHLLASKFCKILQKKIVFFFCKICLRENDFLVDLEKC